MSSMSFGIARSWPGPTRPDSTHVQHGHGQEHEENSSRFQSEIDMHGVEREDYATVVGLLQYSDLQQCVHVTMDRFYVTSQTARRFPNRHWSRARHELEYFPSFARERLEQKRRRLEADKSPLRFSVECLKDSLADTLPRRYQQCYRAHFTPASEPVAFSLRSPSMRCCIDPHISRNQQCRHRCHGFQLLS